MTLSPRSTFGNRWRGPWIWGVLIVTVGLIDSWGSRYNLNPDGISYIEMAQHALAGAPDGFINGYWSPGYPLLIAPLLALWGHDWVAAIPALHLVNLVIYLVAAWLAARLFGAVSAPGLARHTVAIGSAIFVVIAVKCVGLGLITPDFGVTLAVLMTAWCCLQVERSYRSWQWSVTLGVVLGLGFWIKGIMLPLNAMLLLALFILPPRIHRARTKIAIATVAFAIVCLPLVVMVSHRVGRPTMGEVGRLNYAWEVDGVTPFTGWIGDSVPRYGTPHHPPRVLQTVPLTLEFAGPIHATYPLWFDPSYWYAGIEPHLDIAGQWRVLLQGLHDLASLAHTQWVLLVSAIALWLASVRGVARDFRSRVLLTLAGWSGAAALVYALVHVEPRYLAGFLLVGAIAAWSFMSSRTPRPAMRWVAPLVVLAMMVATGRNIFENTGGYQPAYRPDYLVDADKLRAAGVGEGDRLAMIGDAFEAYSAFGAHASITAQLVDSTGFWRLSPAARSDLQAKLAATGVKALLANNVAPEMAAEGWRILARSDSSSNIGVLRLNPR